MGVRVVVEALVGDPAGACYVPALHKHLIPKLLSHEWGRPPTAGTSTITDQPNGGNVAALAGIDHNRARRCRARPAQWQTPHLHDAPAEEAGRARPETDLDLIEAAFVEGFLSSRQT